MTNTRQLHSFYIPVMGTSFTIDTPIRLAHKGISSVISITDDGLIESVRKFYAQKLNLPYEPILKNDEDARARRITAYLDMVKEVVEGNFDKLMNDSPLEGLGKYAQLLPKNASEMISLRERTLATSYEALTQLRIEVRKKNTFKTSVLGFDELLGYVQMQISRAEALTLVSPDAQLREEALKNACYF